MKKLQKISLALALCSLSIFAVGCQEKKGNTEKKEANTTTNNANTIEKKETKVALSNELLQKVTDASKAVKSANAKANLTHKFRSSIKEINTILDFDFSMVKEPAFIVKLTRHADNDGQKLEMINILLMIKCMFKMLRQKSGCMELIKDLEKFMMEEEKL